MNRVNSLFTHFNESFRFRALYMRIYKGIGYYILD